MFSFYRTYNKVFAAIAMIIASSALMPTAAPAEVKWKTVKSMDASPYFSYWFLDAENETRSLKDFEGKVIILHFWATWCAPCVKEIPSIAGLQKRLKDDGLVVIPVSLDNKKEKAVEFYEEQNITDLELYIDTQSRAIRDLNVPGLPTSYIFNREGELIGEVKGEMDWAAGAVMEILTPLLQE